MEFELPGDEAVMRKEGDRLVIEPKDAARDLLDYLRRQEPLREGDEFPDIDGDLLPVREIDL